MSGGYLPWAELLAEFEIKFGMPLPNTLHIGPLQIGVTMLPSGRMLLDARTAYLSQDEFAQLLRIIGGGQHGETVAVQY